MQFQTTSVVSDLINLKLCVQLAGRAMAKVEGGGIVGVVGVVVKEGEEEEEEEDQVAETTVCVCVC